MSKATTIEKNNRFYEQPNGEMLTENEQLKEWLIVANKEIERLNNIINELEKDIIEKINDIKNNYSQVNGNYFNMNYVLDTYEDVLNKLRELKGSVSNE